MKSTWLLSTLVLLASMPINSHSAPPQREPSQLICSMSIFFSFDSDEVISDHAHVEGRGLTSCKSEQGFSIDTPIYADLEIKLSGPVAPGETTFSANSEKFVIPREIAQIDDRFEARKFSWTDHSKMQPTILFRGLRHDLAVEMKLSSTTTRLEKISFDSMRVRFDESAPDLE